MTLDSVTSGRITGIVYYCCWPWAFAGPQSQPDSVANPQTLAQSYPEEVEKPQLTKAESQVAKKSPKRCPPRTKAMRQAIRR